MDTLGGGCLCCTWTTPVGLREKTGPFGPTWSSAICTTDHTTNGGHRFLCPTRLVAFRCYRTPPNPPPLGDIFISYPSICLVGWYNSFTKINEPRG